MIVNYKNYPVLKFMKNLKGVMLPMEWKIIQDDIIAGHDSFKVSGHFRLQPCHDENGLPTKKLIWISDFVKNGYTAPARKLKNNL